MSVELRRRISAAMLALILLLCCYLAPRYWRESHLPLDATAFPAGQPVAVPENGREADEDRTRLPGLPEMAGSTLLPDALRDLNALQGSYGVPVAGWAPDWHYVWPRDAAFAASAFARVGQTRDAERILEFFQDAQPASGYFDARYRPDGSGPPDGRGIQLDGSGWAVWALDQVVSEQLSPTGRRELVGHFTPLLDRSVRAIIAATENGEALPPASPDYWETPERRVTLATCSVLLAGLRSAERLYDVAGQSHSVGVVADRFEQTILDAFAADGFPRHRGGPARSVDLGVTFLMAPFAGVTDAAAMTSWRRSPTFMRRPAGGLAPGGSWRRDGVSWTPTVATYAMVEACQGARAGAVSWLRWLDQHRTVQGALPEKVLANGRPASVAPVGWTAAAVVITADELERGCPDTAR
jgi:glucoamylase